jgi:hypothetical protein
MRCFCLAVWLVKLAKAQRYEGMMGKHQWRCVQVLGVILAIALFFVHVAAADAGNAAKGAELMELHRVRLINEAGGAIEGSRDGGASWIRLGTVLQPVEQINDNGYTASAWAVDGHVAATAVNAIHIKVGLSSQGRGRIFSLLPRDMFAPPTGYSSYLHPQSSIYTDIPSGGSLFGDGFAPVVGSKVFYLSGATGDEGRLLPAAGYVPARGDRLMIVTELPELWPREMLFENREGGSVTMIFADGSSRAVATVVRPVHGVGRFQGSAFTGGGRIRANHCGVICVSTSAMGDLGGFQIVPLEHSNSAEMRGAWSKTQWMIVAPLDDNPLEGRAPLFSSYIYSGYSSKDLYAENWKERMLSRFLVMVKLSDREGWQPMPLFCFHPNVNRPLPDWAASALEKVTEIKISFPMM